MGIFRGYALQIAKSAIGLDSLILEGEQLLGQLVEAASFAANVFTYASDNVTETSIHAVLTYQ